jgi:hypothetical protein
MTHWPRLEAARRDFLQRNTGHGAGDSVQDSRPRRGKPRRRRQQQQQQATAAALGDFDAALRDAMESAQAILADGSAMAARCEKRLCAPLRAAGAAEQGGTAVGRVAAASRPCAPGLLAVPPFQAVGGRASAVAIPSAKGARNEIVATARRSLGLVQLPQLQSAGAAAAADAGPAVHAPEVGDELSEEQLSRQGGGVGECDEDDEDSEDGGGGDDDGGGGVLRTVPRAAMAGLADAVRAAMHAEDEREAAAASRRRNAR